MSDQNIFTGPPNWCPFAAPSVQGWVNPTTGEILISVGGNFTARPEFLNGGYTSPGSAVFIKTVTESRVGTTLVTPQYGANTAAPDFPGDRIVKGPWMGIIHVNDTTTDPHTNIVKGTANFPKETQFYSKYLQDNRSDVRAFGFLDYGNYIDSAATIPAVHIRDITDLVSTWDFLVTQTDQAFNGCIDGFLNNTASGLYAGINLEYQIYWECPNITKTNFLDTLQVVGNYVSAPILGTATLIAMPTVTWKVTYEASNAQGKPYVQLRPIDSSGNTLVFRRGSFDQKALFDWLRTQKVPGQTVNFILNGSEYYTGDGTGYEILRGEVTIFTKSVDHVYNVPAYVGQTASNILAYPGDVSDVAWTRTGVNPTSAVIIKETAVNADHNIRQDLPRPASADTYRLEFRVKKASASGLGRDWTKVNIFPESFDNGISINFNSATGTVGQYYGYGNLSSAFATAPTMTVVDANTYQCVAEFKMDASSAIRLLIGPQAANDGGAYLGDINKGIQIEGIKLFKK